MTSGKIDSRENLFQIVPGVASRREVLMPEMQRHDTDCREIHGLIALGFCAAANCAVGAATRNEIFLVSALYHFPLPVSRLVL